MGVAKRFDGLPCDANFARRKMGYWYITHVETNGSVAEHWELEFCP